MFSVVVVFAFFFCWTPFHTQRLMFVVVTLYGTWTPTLHSVQHILFTYSGENPRLFPVMRIILYISQEKGMNIEIKR